MLLKIQSTCTTKLVLHDSKMSWIFYMPYKIFTELKYCVWCNEKRHSKYIFLNPVFTTTAIRICVCTVYRQRSFQAKPLAPQTLNLPGKSFLKQQKHVASFHSHSSTICLWYYKQYICFPHLTCSSNCDRSPATCWITSS